MSDTPHGEGLSTPARRTIDEVFGDVLSETTSDERDRAVDRSGSDSWYLENRPPHHDG